MNQTTRRNGTLMDSDESESVTVLPMSPSRQGAMLAPTRAEIDIQISTAKAFPRSIKAFRDEAMSLATVDEETAESCFYSVPRGGKPIEGPSVRLAEIVANSWGNLRAQAYEVEEGDRFVIAEAACWDLEKNTAVRVQTRRRITDKHNKRFNDDMIAVTMNAAKSIALREAVFKIVPRAFVKPIYEAARLVAIGDVKTLAAKRDAMVQHFAKMGVVLDRVLASVERQSIDDVTLENLAYLKGLASAIKEGEITIETAFPIPTKAEDRPTGSKADALAAKLTNAPPPAPNTTDPAAVAQSDAPSGGSASKQPPAAGSGGSVVDDIADQLPGMGEKESPADKAARARRSK